MARKEELWEKKSGRNGFRYDIIITVNWNLVRRNDNEN